MDSQEFLEWQDFYRESPWGDERGDLRSGIVASTIANVHRGKGQAPFRPQDFMPRYDRQARRTPQTPEQIRHLFRAFTRAAGGTVHEG